MQRVEIVLREASRGHLRPALSAAHLAAAAAAAVLRDRRAQCSSGFLELDVLNIVFRDQRASRLSLARPAGRPAPSNNTTATGGSRCGRANRMSERRARA